MRRLIVAMVAVAAITATTSVEAAPPPPALAVAQAMMADPSLAVSASWVLLPTQGGVSAGTAVVSSVPLLGMPGGGSSFVLFSSGDAPQNLIQTPNQMTGSFVNAAGTDAHAFASNDINDLTVLQTHIEVPGGANCLALNVRFLSQEWPRYVGQYNDGFMVELDRNDWVSIDPQAGGGFTAPGNFVFDGHGSPLSVNGTGSFGIFAANASGTGFSFDDLGGDGGGSELLTALTPVTAGAHDLYFSIFDQGDHQWDSGAMVDNLHVYTTSHCPVGAFQPNEPAPLAPSVIAVPPNPSTNAPFSFEAQPGDLHANTFECAVDGGAWTACTSGDDVAAGLADGPHTFQVRALNSIALAGPPSALEYFVLDTRADPPAITAQPPAITSATSATIAFVGEPGATFECNTDGAGWAACSASLALADLGEGSHTFAVRQTDSLGHQSLASMVTWTVDTKAPDAPAFAVTGTASPGSATITITGTAGDTLECSLDGAAWAVCTSPFQLSGLVPGAHRALMRATDAAGNTSASAVYDFVVAPPFVVQVRYRLPITCTAGCTTRAWLYEGHQLVARQTLLGQREGLVIRHGLGRVRFFIPIPAATLSGAPATTTATSLTIETRLVVTLTRPHGKTIWSVRYGHIKVSLGRIASGLPPAIPNVL